MNTLDRYLYRTVLVYAFMVMVVMLTLAEHYSAKNNSAEATRLYSQIKSEYPDTPIAQQADQELNLLPGKS